MINFRVYYADAEPYAGDPFLAPALGVLVIVEVDPEHGRRLVSSKDYYIWDGGRWWSVDYIGMLDYLIRPGAKRVLFGRTVENEAWYATMRLANEDPDFPARTAWGAKEERLND